MSVIAWDGVTLSADRRVTDEARIMGRVRKIAKINGCLVGWAGSLRNATCMMAWFSEGANPDPAMFPSLSSEAVELLVIRPNYGGIWVYEKSNEPYEMLQHQYAIGSGDTVAMALMMAGKTSREAVELVARVRADCGDGIDSLTFDQAE